jgi:hypothetical protein
MEVLLRRGIRVNEPGPAGEYVMETGRSYAAVPRTGDHVELASGWASLQVRNVTFLADGRLRADLQRMVTNDPERVADALRLVESHGWHWLGKAPGENP